MDKIKILYLPIETVVRELDGNLFLAYEALKRGYKVVLGRTNETIDFAKNISSGVFISKAGEILPSFEKNRDNYCLIGFHPEGIVFSDKKNLRKALLGYDAEDLDLIFVNGENQEKILKKDKLILKDKVKVVGSPRFDILRPALKKVFSREIKKIRKKYNNYFLINTNFTSGNPSSMYGNDFISFLRKLHKNSYNRDFDEEENNYVVNGIEYNKKLFNYYKKAIVFLSKEFPEINFILRPHPSENHENWRKAFSGLKNVKVIFKGNVINWILGAEAIIHTGCTTGIEAWAARKPVIRYNPITERSPFESELPNRFGKYASSPEELKIILKEIIEGNYKIDFEEKVNIAKPFIDSIDGDLSVVKIMNIIDKECKCPVVDIESKISKYPSVKKKTIAKLKKLRRFVLTKSNIMKFFVGKKKANLMASRFQKFLPGIKKNYILQFFDLLAQEKGWSKNLFIKEIGADTYFIETKKQ